LREINVGLSEYSKEFLPAIEEQLKDVTLRAKEDGLEDLHEMLCYHMGWVGPGSGPEATGKRIRPQLLLLVTASCGREWRSALPAAAAVELLHNFSLIHDDIEDRSSMRRGRETVWSRWGIPLAINAGDAMFTLSFLSLHDLEESTTVVETTKVLLETSLQLTQGQHLDISYENKMSLPEEAYWQMIGGKTAALISACCELGSITGGADMEIRHAYLQFGRYLGLAFQAHDDYLGIWGDSALTGKSAESDLVSGKKSLPIVFGLQQNGAFAQRWSQGKIREEEVPEVSALLEREGGLEFTRNQVGRLTSEAITALDHAAPMGEPGSALRELAEVLLNRHY